MASLATLDFLSQVSQGGNWPRFCVGMRPGKTNCRKYTHNPGKIFHLKPPKTYQNDMNLLIFLDLSYKGAVIKNVTYWGGRDFVGV